MTNDAARADRPRHAGGDELPRRAVRPQTMRKPMACDMSSLGWDGGFAAAYARINRADLTPARRHAMRWLWDFLFWPSLLAWIATIAVMLRSIVRGW